MMNMSPVGRNDHDLPILNNRVYFCPARYDLIFMISSSNSAASLLSGFNSRDL